MEMYEFEGPGHHLYREVSRQLWKLGAVLERG